jgi:hypothetical protein
VTLIPLGVVGVLAILPSVAQSLRTVLAELPGAPPVGVLVAVQTVQLLLLMVGGVLLGAWAAPRVGFTSRLLERDRTSLRRDVLVALLPGILAGVWIVVGDLVTAPFLGADWAQSAAFGPRSVGVTVAGMLYGGITEELMLRWGAMSGLAYAGWRLFARRSIRPPAVIVVAAIVLSAVLFGVLHLGAVAAVVPLTPLIVARTIALNAVAGIIFGTLFARRSLEAAMVAHAASHVTVTALSLLL